MMEIPKIIHYCWFGGNTLPASAKKCIASWRKYLPDYEIKEWNESNFNINSIPYTAEAYQAKKYAFVSDYARFWILYKYGGLYFDTDVEIIKNMDDIIAKGAFMGCENKSLKGKSASSLGVAPGLGLGTFPNHTFYGEILQIYENMKFILDNGVINNENIVTTTTKLLCYKGLQNIDGIQLIDGIYIYPKEYFCPKNYSTGRLDITNNTRSIHHYDASWLPWYVIAEHKFCYKLHIPCHDLLNKLFYTKTFLKDLKKKINI